LILGSRSIDDCDEEETMEWLKALAEDDLAEGERQVIQIDDQSILLIQYQGRIYAVVSTCPHMGAPLKDAKITDHTLTCPRHHSAFDLDTGDVKEWSPWPPAVGRMLGALSRQKALKTFPTKVEDGAIWIGVERGGD
jgi:nitrite reductase/ring-hydroxylating ferredoxin subunit